MQDWGWFFSGLQNVKLSSIRISKRSKHYYKVPARWAQYETPVLPFLPRPSILSYYSSLGLQGCVENRITVLMIALKRSMIMAGVMVLINAQNGDFFKYYTVIAWHDNLSGGMLFRLQGKIVDAIRFFGLYKFTLCMGTDLGLEALAIHQCTEIDCTKRR